MTYELQNNSVIYDSYDKQQCTSTKFELLLQPSFLELLAISEKSKLQ